MPRTPSTPNTRERRGRPPREDREPLGIGSVEISIAVLSALAEHGTACSLGDLAQATGMSASKLHRYLASFIRTGMVVKSPSSGLYDLGPAARRIGLLAFNRFDGMSQIYDRIGRLRAASGETIVLYVWSESGPTVVRWEPGENPLPLSLRVGSTVPLTRSATGRVFLAFMPASVTGPIAKRDEAFAAADGLADISPENIAALVSGIRSEGISVAADGIFPGIQATAVPVFDFHGGLICVITALVQRRFITAKSDESLRRIMLEHSREISRAMGHSGE